MDCLFKSFVYGMLLKRMFWACHMAGQNSLCQIVNIWKEIIYIYSVNNATLKEKKLAFKSSQCYIWNKEILQFDFKLLWRLIYICAAFTCRSSTAPNIVFLVEMY